MVTALIGVVLATPAIGTEPASPRPRDVPLTSRPTLRCEPAIVGHDKLQMICTVAPSERKQLRVRVHLTGSHDDTAASMDIVIDGASVACEAGNKTRTEGEDGDVTLECRFTVVDRKGSSTVLTASAKWYHAQYVGVEVDEARP